MIGWLLVEVGAGENYVGEGAGRLGDIKCVKNEMELHSLGILHRKCIA